MSYKPKSINKNYKRWVWSFAIAIFINVYLLGLASFIFGGFMDLLPFLTFLFVVSFILLAISYFMKGTIKHGHQS